MSEKYGFVYIWRDRKHNRYYIGSHWGTEDDGYICSSNWMATTYRRRPQDFKRRVISRVTTTRKDLLEKEHEWLSLIPTEQLGKNYYNLTQHRPGHWTENPNSLKTVGEKISKAHKSNPNWGSWAKGKIVSEETKEKIRQNTNKQFSNPDNRKVQSDITKEKWKDPEYKAKLVASHSGKTASAETKLKMSIARLGKPSATKGRKQTQEHRDKIRAKVVGSKRGPMSEETKQKIAATKKLKPSVKTRGSSGMFWVTDGVINKMTQSAIPDGFYRGRSVK